MSSFPQLLFYWDKDCLQYNTWLNEELVLHILLSIPIYHMRIKILPFNLSHYNTKLFKYFLDNTWNNLMTNTSLMQSFSLWLTFKHAFYEVIFRWLTIRHAFYWIFSLWLPEIASISKIPYDCLHRELPHDNINLLPKTHTHTHTHTHFTPNK